MRHIILRELFTVGLALFIILFVLEWFLPGFATNHINITAYALTLLVLGVFM